MFARQAMSRTLGLGSTQKDCNLWSMLFSESLPNYFGLSQIHFWGVLRA